MLPINHINGENMRKRPQARASYRKPVLGQMTENLSRTWAHLRNYFGQPEKQLFWGIVLLSAALRLGYLDLIEFKADEVNHLLRGLEIVEQHKLPLAGTPSSVGITKPPLMSYLMAIPLLFGRDPRIASAFIGLLNVAS